MEGANRTLQEWLVDELRLAEISSVEVANDSSRVHGAARRMLRNYADGGREPARHVNLPASRS